MKLSFLVYVVYRWQMDITLVYNPKCSVNTLPSPILQDWEEIGPHLLLGIFTHSCAYILEASKGQTGYQ